MKNTLLTLYIIFLVIATGFGVGAATDAGILIPASVPFALILIALLYYMGGKPELLAWAALTVGLLGGTYLQTGEPIEYGMYFIYMLLTALGIFKSPYFLALAWLFHPVWDFVPRTLPQHMHDLPLACAFFDTPIGLYLLWGSWKKRWISFGEDSKDAYWQIGKTFFVGMLIVGISYAAIMAAETKVLIWAALPLAAVVIFSFRAMGARAEWLAWAVLTGWLGMTYAHTGNSLDAVVFFVYVVISALGVFVSPYFLAAAWLAFIPWNFVPHELSLTYPDFPLACAIYCLPVGLYLLWAIRKKHFVPADAKRPSEMVTTVI